MERPSISTKRHSRPIRTYSKRTQPDAGAERPFKKRRTTSDDEQRITDTKEDILETLQVQPLVSAPSLPEQPKKKGSIMDYFKVRSPNSDAMASCVASSDSALPSSTPPSSPPPREALPRKRRRLATRPLSPARDLEIDEDDGPRQYSLEEKPRSTPRRTLPLQRTGGSALNRRAAGPGPGMGDAVKRYKSKATVQTTLSLSMTEKQFVECKDCEMLYNPFYENDARLHARRHAAMLKNKRRIGGME